MELHETQTSPRSHDDFEVWTADALLREVKVEQPKMLFGELWREGEIAVMVGGTSSGKSLLLLQIAESIARGKGVEPFEMTAEAQKVLFLDLGQTAAQFTRRYRTDDRTADVPSACETDKTPEPKKKAPKTKEQSDEELKNLIHVSLKRSVQIAPAKLGPLIEETGAKVLVIDSLAYLQKYSMPRETAVVMRELRRLRNRYGLSILVLMNTSRSFQRGIVAADIPCSNVVTSYADNIFAVGRSGSRSVVRYIKHIKHSFDDVSYGAAHVPYFAIMACTCSRFPTFHHIGYASEATLREHDNDHWEWQRIRKIKELADKKKTIREISEALQISRSTVHRLLQMAGDAPPLPSPGAFVEDKVQQFYAKEKCIVEGCTDMNCSGCFGRPASNRSLVSENIHGHDKYACPDDCDLCGPRRYKPTDEVDPDLRKRSDDHYTAVRNWLLGGKQGPRPVYEGARRYGVARTGWFPGSEHWTEDQVEEYRNWLRTSYRTHAPEPEFARRVRDGP